MKTKTLILTALFTALTAIGAFIKIPFAFSSITLQFFFTALAGVLLGANYGALSQLVYVVLGLIGLPIFTMGGGISYVFYPTFGFLIGLVPAAWVIGKLAEKHKGTVGLIVSCFVGLAVLYVIGLPYMALILNGYMGKGMDFWAICMAGMIPFLPGDCVKIVVTAYLGKHLLPRIQTILN
ncbi:MAG: biotin transporter BioY [Oscillospiraceae bacterium]|jgi:biotin transport system substrate-specific component